MRTRRGVSTTAVAAVVIIIVIIVIAAVVLIPSTKSTSSTNTSSSTVVTSAQSSNTTSSPSTTSSTTTTTSTNPDAALYQTALTEGKVSVFGSPTAVQFANITAAFNAVYPGISVNYTSEQPPQAVPLVKDTLQATGHSVADVLLEAATTIYPLEQAGAPCPCVTPYVSPYSSQFPSAVLDPLNQSTPIIELAFGWAYNTNLINAANVPTTMAQVANSQFNGEVVMNDPTTGTAFTQYWASLATYLGNSTVYGFLQNLKSATNPVIVSTTTSCMNSVASGTYAICLGGYMQDAAPDIQLGSPMKFLNITGLPLMITPSDAAILKGAADPAAAQLLVDFMASPAGQTAWGDINVRTPVSQTVTATWSLASEIKTFDPGAGPQVYFPTPALANDATAWAATFTFLSS